MSPDVSSPGDARVLWSTVPPQDAVWHGGESAPPCRGFLSSCWKTLPVLQGWPGVRHNGMIWGGEEIAAKEMQKHRGLYAGSGTLLYSSFQIPLAKRPLAQWQTPRPGMGSSAKQWHSWGLGWGEGLCNL